MTAAKAQALPGRATLVGSAFILVSLYLTSFYDYLLFHSLAELFSIVIAFAIFMFAWNTRQHVENGYFLFLGISYLCVGTLDTLHTLSYQGMQLFKDYDYYANQLWIAARYLESLSLLAAFYFLPKERSLNVAAALVGYGGITGLLLLSIFYWKIFPECFVAGTGLTPFKIYSEYVICALLGCAMALLYQRRSKFSPAVFLLICYSLIATIVAELAFTFYISNYGLSNLVGHVFKIISFTCIYEAIIATGLKAPHDLLYLQLKQNEAELRKTNDVKDRLFKIIAHDLKSPFNTLMGLSKFLQENFEQLDDAGKREFIDHIQTAATRTHKLLDNLLQWSQMQTNSIRFAPAQLGLHALIDENLALHQETARQKGITLKSVVQGSPVVFADANMASTVIRNLISNAIKFTDQGGEVSISSQSCGNFEEISIADTGTGMGKEDVDKLFGQGLAVSRPGTRQEHGTGLGLMLCQEFIEAHGGHIRVESVLGEGSRFIFTLPKTAAVATATPV